MAEEILQKYYQQLALYPAQFPYQNFVDCSKYLDFWSNNSLLFVDGRYLIEEDDCVYGLY